MLKRISLVVTLVGTLALESTAQAQTAATIPLDAATIADVNRAFDAGWLTSEQLVQKFLARIKEFDRQGPSVRALILVNPKALEQARHLDAERKSKGRRSPLHGIPVVLKDNIDTADQPTTAGSVLLEGSVPPDDAFLVKSLRNAGAVIIGKANMSEFASGIAHSSLGGPMKNPHDLARTPLGSSGGSGIAVAAAFAMVAIGTDTGGSIRNPASTTGIAGLKPTHGLVSRDGIVPLALSFDTAGPMARNVHDLAVTLGTIAAIDPADEATSKSEGRVESDYTRFLKADALNGARIGVARDFSGIDTDVDWTLEASVAAMRRAGATVVDVRFPKWLLDVKGEFYNAIRFPEFVTQVADYLKTLDARYPKDIEQLLARAAEVNAPRADGGGPNPVRWTLMKRETAAGGLNDYRYTSVRDHGLPMVRAVVEGVMSAQKLDAIVYPTLPRRAPLFTEAPEAPGGSAATAVNLANLTGFPDLIVPAGFTADGLPVTLSFLGPAFSEPRLFALGYSFEQLTRARRLPVHTPALMGDAIRIK
jgi:amidase